MALSRPIMINSAAASPHTSSSRRRFFAALGAALALAAAPNSALARRGRGRGRGRGRRRRGGEYEEFYEDLYDDDGRDEFRSDDHYNDRVAAAIRSGDLQPLRALNARLRALGFELLDAELLEAKSGWVYDIRVLGPAGRVRDVLIDGRTLRRLRNTPRFDPLD